MKIYYSPEYEGHLYLRPQDGSQVLMDALVVNTPGLVQLLALRLGCVLEQKPQHERVALYYEAMNRYIKECPDSVLAQSFNLSGLSTAKTVLGWRDELRMAGCRLDASMPHGEQKVCSQRLQAIWDIEEFFKEENGADLVDLIKMVEAGICRQSVLFCHDYEILLPCPLEILRPMEKDFLTLLSKHGASICQLPFAENSGDNLSLIRQMIAEGRKDNVMLNSQDDSFLVYEFSDENEANQYLAYKDFKDVDVWINTDNKQMDNWLSLMNKPLTGSRMQDSSPQLTELLVIGVSLFMNPLNVNSLIEWLNMPLHPLNAYFRSRLADAIVNEGGYRNEVCQQMIDEYVAGKFVYLTEEDKLLSDDEIDKIRKKDSKMRRTLVETFLPAMQVAEDISAEDLKRFVSALGTWAMQTANMRQSQENQLLYVEQLGAVKSMTDAFLILLGTIDKDSVDAKMVDSWLSSIYTKSNFTNAIAKQGSRIVLDSPAKLVSIANQTIWMGVEGDSLHPQECSFLYPSEKEELVEKGIWSPWDENQEREYQEWMGMMPLFHTAKKMILVVCKRRGGEVTQKHSLMVRLEQQVENLADVIFSPMLESEALEKVEAFTNVNEEDEVNFRYADKLCWPDHLSPTTVGTLVEYPFDYLMENLLKITADGKAQMANVKTTKGNVAHAVIAHLFAPRQGKRTASANEIAERIITEYEDVFLQVLEANGAILQLAENKLEGKLLHEQLRACLDVLVGILKGNQLKVTGCEQLVKYGDILGFMDMTCEDKDGHPVVFDFKWTSSKGYHRGLLEQNRSIQLELYRYLLTKEKKDEVKKVAYFLMPEARLYSKEPFAGESCTQIEPIDDTDIVAELMRSIAYRKQQLSKGVVEVNGFFEEIPYVVDTEDKGLYPLERDGNEKKGNIFSNYELFL